MRRRVLIAEDNAGVHEVLVRHLENAGYECLRAYDGVEALKLFRHALPDAAVLDLNLPGLHGLELLRAIKEIRPDVVVVIVTGHGTEQAAIRALKLGADDYLQKPVRSSVLIHSLQKNFDRTEGERNACGGNAPWAIVPDGRLAGILFEAPTPLLCSDNRGHIVAANREAARLLGQGPDRLLGRRVDEFVDPVHRTSWLETVRLETREGRTYEAEIFFLGGDGERIPVNATAVATQEGDDGCLILSLRDLTQQKALELHYFEARKLASLGRVVEGVAHEVRNPLVSVGGFTRKLLEEFHGDGRERRYLEVILSDVQRLEHMVREIEDYVSFMNRRRASFAPVDVGTVLKDAVARVSSRFPARGVQLRWKEPETLPAVFGDEGLLGSLFEGLAENAFEAMPTGGELTAAWEAVGNWARVRMSDTGVGIADGDLSEIFNPFVTTKMSGAGLGLAKAYMIVEEHSGTIEFESRAGKGTVCSVSLPVDRRRLRRVHA